jgi:hypothetical protein
MASVGGFTQIEHDLSYLPHLTLLSKTENALCVHPPLYNARVCSINAILTTASPLNPPWGYAI